MTRVAIAGVAALGVLAGAGQARAEPVAVLVVPAQEVWAQADRGAVGLLVPGAGATVTREQALQSLTTGRSVSGLAGEQDREPLITIATRPGPLTIYVALPPAGRHHNVTRYPVAIVGGGFHGILDSPSTRLPGLVSIADVAPTAVDLEQGTKPVLGFRPGNAASLRELDLRLTRAHDSRAAATAGLAALLVCLTAAAFATRSRRLARTALLAAPAAISIALLLSAAGIRSPLAVGLAVAAGGAAAAFVAGRREALFAPAVALFLAGFLVVLAVFPETNALAAIGPHPDGGVRFFGVTNQVETLLLAPVLAAAATSRRWLATVGLLALVALGWSRAGADGGGVLVLLAGLGALVVQDGLRRVSVVRVALAGAAVARARASPRRGRRRPRRVEPRDDRGRRRAFRPRGRPGTAPRRDVGGRNGVVARGAPLCTGPRGARRDRGAYAAPPRDDRVPRRPRGVARRQRLAGGRARVGRARRDGASRLGERV